jgi:hypothetical protein
LPVEGDRRDDLVRRWVDAFEDGLRPVPRTGDPDGANPGRDPPTTEVPPGRGLEGESSL